MGLEKAAGLFVAQGARGVRGAEGVGGGGTTSGGGAILYIAAMVLQQCPRLLGATNLESSPMAALATAEELS